MRIVLIIIGAAAFVLFAAPVFHQVFNFGNIAGLSYALLAVLDGVLFDVLPQRLRAWATLIVALGGILGVVFMKRVYDDGKTTSKNEDIAIVLGCRVKGEKPSLALLKRADSAYKFLLCNPHSVAILSGGQGNGEKISEAECLRRILCDKGISPDRLLLEDKSTSTDENIMFSKNIAELNGYELKSAAIVTSEYHQRRAKIICERYGIEASAQSSHTMPILLPTFLLRELIAILKEQLNK